MGGVEHAARERAVLGGQVRHQRADVGRVPDVELGGVLGRSDELAETRGHTTDGGVREEDLEDVARARDDTVAVAVGSDVAERGRENRRVQLVHTHGTRGSGRGTGASVV